MTPRRRTGVFVGILIVIVAATIVVAYEDHGARAVAKRPTASPAPHSEMPPVVDASNIYSEATAGHVRVEHRHDPPFVYVPNSRSNTLSIIDATTRRVVRTVKTGAEPQHVVPAYDLSTLWLLDNQGNDVRPINPATGDLGAPISVEDPYNLYFTPDGSSAIVVAESRKRLDFRDPHTMQLTGSLAVPDCAGMNHADYDVSGSYLLLTCEYAGKLAKIDMTRRSVVGILDLNATHLDGVPPSTPMKMPDGSVAASMPQDVRTAPDGHHFYVADMVNGGVFVVDGDAFTATKFIPTGTGAHGLTPARDGSVVYVANRGSPEINGPAHGPGSVSVIDVQTNTVTARWSIPFGGSPDMGNVNQDGSQLWLSGRFDAEVYVFDTASGALQNRIRVGNGPHGLVVWPQAGRYSLGHTGNMR